MARDASTSLPLVIADWPRSERERVKITLADDVIDVRCFFVGDDHEPHRAGRTGITLGLHHLQPLAAGITKALTEAKRRGLVDGVTNG